MTSVSKYLTCCRCQCCRWLNALLLVTVLFSLTCYLRDTDLDSTRDARGLRKGLRKGVRCNPATVELGPLATKKTRKLTYLRSASMSHANSQSHSPRLAFSGGATEAQRHCTVLQQQPKIILDSPRFCFRCRDLFEHLADASADVLRSYGSFYHLGSAA